jgi:hypothetical protein
MPGPGQKPAAGIKGPSDPAETPIANWSAGYHRKNEVKKVQKM